MKNAKLNVWILTGLTLLLGVLMAVLNLSPSWSQSAGNSHDFLLYGCLFCISSALMIASFAHPEKDKEISKFPILGTIRLEHSFRLTAYFFGGVIACSVNSELWLIETLHLIFTALAITSGYVGLMLYPDTNKGHTYALIGFIFGVGGFLIGYIFGWYSIAWGEVLASIPLAVFMLKTWKN